jgi:uncharacterized protein YecT (DUF1311 family)
MPARGRATNNTSVLSCSQEVSAQVKGEINALYHKTYARLDEDSPEDAAAFEKAQKAWLKYRNGHCALAGDYVGSPMYEHCPMQSNIARVNNRESSPATEPERPFASMMLEPNDHSRQNRKRSSCFDHQG